MGNLRSHAERELRAQGYNLEQTEEDPNKWMCQSVLELIDLFAAQGHSGFSAPHCVALFTKLARFEPLGPLNGTPDEWMEAAEGVEQNVRCSHVFRENGEAYDINGKIFREPNGCTYTNKNSRVPVEFPYTPTSVVVDVPAT